MTSDLWTLYRQMLRSRRFEESVKELWDKGMISGEMHLGIGEEAIAAGVVGQLEEGDAIALDHRNTPELVVRGVDLVLLLREFLGRSDGLCSGMGGHLHLFSQEHLVASSGIVGCSGPMSAGFALAAQQLRPGNLAVAFFGEGAMNQGMLLESMNLAVVWKLPVIFVCKDNKWAITTRSHSVTGGKLIDRARAFGMYDLEVDGTDVEEVYNAAGYGTDRARNGDGPTFLLADCPRFEGHFLGDPLIRTRSPIDQWRQMIRPPMRSFLSTGGTSVDERMAGMGKIVSLMGRAKTDKHWRRHDPIDRISGKLSMDRDRLNRIEKEVNEEIRQVVKTALSSR